MIFVRMAELPDHKIAMLMQNEKADKKLAPLKIPEGGRHSHMVSLAGYYRHKGYNEEQIYSLLASVNAVSFHDGLSDEELEGIARGCSKYKSLYNKFTVNLDDVEEKAIECIIKPYISKYDVNILEGEPGSGKSTLLGEIAACITTGKKFCGIKPDLVGDVLFFAIEDNPSTVFKTRARIQGADFKKIDFVDGYLALDNEGFSYLEEALSQKKYTLVIIDTLTASLAGMRMNDSGDMARLIRSLTDFARRYKTTFLVLRHFRKAGAEQAGHIGMGSMAITGGVRSSMMLKVCPENPSKRYLAHNKSNGLKKGATLTFVIQDPENEDSEIGQLVWTGTSNLTDDDLLSLKKEPVQKKDEATVFLEKTLSKGPVDSETIEREASEIGISIATLRRAKKDLKIKSRRKGKTWVWSLK